MLRKFFLGEMLRKMMYKLFQQPDTFMFKHNRRRRSLSRDIYP